MSLANSKVTNVVVAGLGGQGVLKASDILVEAVFRAGLDVKKSEVHGMSQRGGSVASDVRFGPQVFSPMVAPGQADFLVVLAPDQVEPNRWLLKPDGILITPDTIEATKLPNRKSLNVALLGCLSSYLDLPENLWLESLRTGFPEAFYEANLKAFTLGKDAARTAKKN